MRKKGIVMTVVFILLAFSFIYIRSFVNSNKISKLPQGTFLTESTSQDGAYTIRTYLCGGGATTDFAVRGELVTNNKISTSKNIYWEYNISSADIIWEDNDTVIINSRRLNLPNDKYDWREQ